MSDERRKTDQELSSRVAVLEQGQKTILKQMDKHSVRLEINTDATLRVETNTAPLVKLAKQIEGAGSLIRGFSEALRILLKTMIYGGLVLGIFFAGVYALLHEGHLPEWFRSLLRLYKEVD